MDQTKKASFSFLVGLLLCTSGLRAQTWLAQDAVWHYGIDPNGGYETRAYVEDTLIEGWTAQKLAGMSIVFDVVNLTWDTIQNVEFTSLQDSIVYLWAQQSGTWAWDTLYLFNGIPGDRWWPIHGENCPAPWGMLEVQDTSTTVIEGIPLRTWCVAYLDEDGDPMDPGCFEVYERIGSIRGLIPPPSGCFPIEAVHALWCYADVDIPLYETGVSPTCTFPIGIDEHGGHARLSIFPNPGSDVLHIDAGTAVRTDVHLFDGMGRLVATTTSASGQAQLDTHAMPSGTYVIKVTTPLGSHTSKWTKR